MNIAVGCDHVGFALKPVVIAHLESKGHRVIDLGCQGSERVDYPLYAQRVAQSVVGGESQLGVLICGTGVGISIAANKMAGVRAVVCSEPYSAAMGRRHNDANILAFGARVVGPDLACMILDHFLEASYEGGRHQARVDMIAALEGRG